MPHVALVPLSGFRIREQEMYELGMRMPGLAARRQAIAELPALGLLTLAGMLPENWTCSYHPFSSIDDQAVQTLVTQQPDLVAVSALTASVRDAYQLADQLRENDIRTVFGGLHATCCADEAAAHFDAVAVGHGENTWPDILRDAAAGRLCPRYESGPQLDGWPTPRFDLLGDRPHRFTLQTQRGCPLACEFCGASRLLGRFAEKPVEQLHRELSAITEIRPRPLLELADDNTFVCAHSYEPLLDLLQESTARWFTEADWRIGERPELLNRLAAAGCLQVLVGIESIIFRYRGMGQKQAELDRVMAALDRIQQAGVAVNGCFIIGADGETRRSMDRLVEFVLRSELAEVQLTVQTPFPGTSLYQSLAAAGRLLPQRDWSFYTLFDVTFQPDAMSVADLEASYRDAVQKLFNADATRRREAIRDQVWSRNLELRL